MKLIDKQYLATPFYGSRRMTIWLLRQGYEVNCKRVMRLMRKMDLIGLAPGPNTSKPHPEHKVYSSDGLVQPLCFILGTVKYVESGFYVRALERTLRYNKPEIFNTDQGSQFTSNDFTGVLEKNSIRISMDSRGRALDNIFVERLWRSLKYECVYLNNYEDLPNLMAGLR